MTNASEQKPDKKKPLQMLGGIAGVGGFLAGAIAVQFLMNGGKSDSQQIEEQFARLKTGAIIKQEFPEEYASAIADLTVIARDKSLSDLQRSQKAAELTAQLRVKYSEFAGRAPDPALRDVLEAQAGMLKTLEAKFGAKLCSEVVNKGPIAMLGTPAARQLNDTMDAGGAAMMMAMAEGRRNPVNRGGAGTPDFDALQMAMQARGATDAQLEMMEDSAISDEDCTMAIAMLDAALAMPGESGERIRSYIVDGSAATP